jgi:hypothetical protein
MDGIKRYFNYVVNQTFTGANVSIIKLLRVTSEYDFVIQKITYKATSGDFTVRCINSEMQWSNNRVQADNFGGTIQYPALLLQPLVINKNSNIELEIVNGATASNVIQIVFEGYLTPNAVPTGRQWFQYVSNIAFTGISQQTIAEIKVSSNKNFVIHKFMAKPTVDDFQVDIIDANEKWTQEYVKSGCLFGTAQRPNILLTPITVVANSSILFQLINGSTATNNIQLCVEGYLEG